MGLADRKLGQFLLSFLYVSGNQLKAKIKDECGLYSLWTLSVYNSKTKQVCELIHVHVLFKILSLSQYRYIYMINKTYIWHWYKIISTSDIYLYIKQPYPCCTVEGGWYSQGKYRDIALLSLPLPRVISRATNWAIPDFSWFPRVSSFRLLLPPFILFCYRF